MTGPSHCRCLQCGEELDPTAAFQKSPCCSARLRRARCHYVCARCHAVIPSRYLFDERLFDAAYFAEKMAESRDRKHQQREEIRRWLAENRSDALSLDDLPDLAAVPGLIESLDSFSKNAPGADVTNFQGVDEFHMDIYRQAILSALGSQSLYFHAFHSLNADPRRERARRFMTLVFMEQAHEVYMRQDGPDILVIPYEAHD